MMRKPTIAILYLAALTLLVLAATPGLAADPIPSDLVTLRGDIIIVGGLGETTTFKRILRNGNTTNYTLPAKKVMVVTDVEWVVEADSEKNFQFSLTFMNQQVYAAAMNLQGLAGPDNLFHGKYRDRLNTGFAMANHQLKAQAVASSLTPTSVTVFIRGYFTANK